MSMMREQFEEWAFDKYDTRRIEGDGDYFSADTRHAWSGWESATEAAKATGTAGEPDILLGEFLVEARKRAGLSLRQVEAATGQMVSNPYLSQLEKGKIAEPSPKMLHALAKVYGVDYAVLMRYAGYIFDDTCAEAARQPAPVVAVKTWQERMDQDPALLELGALHQENAELRAALAARSQP